MSHRGISLEDLVSPETSKIARGFDFTGGNLQPCTNCYQTRNRQRGWQIVAIDKHNTRAVLMDDEI